MFLSPRHTALDRFRYLAALASVSPVSTLPANAARRVYDGDMVNSGEVSDYAVMDGCDLCIRKGAALGDVASHASAE
jgi:hypothetical protein